MTEVIKVEDCGENIGDYGVQIYNAALIPENPTNGDMIKAMFPDAEIRFTVNLSDMHAVHVKFGDNTYICYDNHLFSREWWNAPYKKESEVR